MKYRLYRMTEVSKEDYIIFWDHRLNVEKSQLKEFKKSAGKKIAEMKRNIEEIEIKIFDANNKKMSYQKHKS